MNLRRGAARQTEQAVEPLRGLAAFVRHRVAAGRALLAVPTAPLPVDVHQLVHVAGDGRAAPPWPRARLGRRRRRRRWAGGGAGAGGGVGHARGVARPLRSVLQDDGVTGVGRVGARAAPTGRHQGAAG